MDVVRWTPDDVARRSGAAIPDELIGAAVVVLDGFGPDERLTWVRDTPCPVVAVGVGGVGPADADAVVASDRIDELVASAVAAPRAAAVLVDVMRTVEHLDITAGLRVESLAYSTLLASSEFTTWLDAQPRRPPKQLTERAVLVGRDGGRVSITLNRPENRNAFSAEMRDALHDALLSASLDPGVDAVVLDAVGPVFSSGGDLVEFGSAADVAVAHSIRTSRSVGALLSRLPVTVHVHGGCVGAGVELPAFAPEVVARPDTTFRLPELAMGLIPGAGGTVSVTRRIGRRRATELALSGREIGVDEALAAGLVDGVSE